MIWKGCVLINVRVESYERFDWLMGLWGKFAMSTEMFSGLILITGSNIYNFMYGSANKVHRNFVHISGSAEAMKI